MIRQATPRIVAIVQARMGSTRFPGKVLQAIAGKPLLWHVVHRLRGCRTLDAIAIATSTDVKDDAIAKFCCEQAIACIRGSEDNVLARYAQAASETGADIIVRVSADAPFLDAGFIDHLVDALIAQDGDYVLLPPDAKCAHQGVDVFTRRALDKLVREAADDPTAKEHVSGYFKLKPNFVRIVYAAPDARFAYDGARLTIDTPDDLMFIQTLHERMQANAGEASLPDLLLLLEREPKLKSINAHVRQKGLQQEAGLALIRCDGSHALGYGHIKRCLTLARSLRNREGLGVLFALNGDETAAASIREAGFEAVLLPNAEQSHALAGLVAVRRPDMLIVDARDNLTRDHLARLAVQVGIVAVIDDGSDRRLAATHAYYPPVPQVDALSWKGARTKVRTGWEWALLGFDNVRVVDLTRKDPSRPTLMVSMGGSDPLDLTLLAARAACAITATFQARFIIGPGFRNADILARDIEGMNPNFAAVRNVADMRGEFAQADLALVSFGVTAYELAALGVPALYLALTDDHALSASSFEKAGMGEVLGVSRVLRAEDISRKLWRLIADPERRRDMRAAALNTIDGRAGERIAADLADALQTARRPRAVSR